MADTRRELLNSIEHKAFEPILDAKESEYPPDKRATLSDVQGATRSTMQRYEDEKSAGDVYREYKDDLSSKAAKKTSAQIESLGLPTLRSIQPEVDKIAHDAGLRASGRRR
jgi:hypothetical protein